MKKNYFLYPHTSSRVLFFVIGQNFRAPFFIPTCIPTSTIKPAIPEIETQTLQYILTAHLPALMSFATTGIAAALSVRHFRRDRVFSYTSLGCSMIHEETISFK